MNNSRMKVHFSSESNEWATPQALYDRINGIYGPFHLDPCCTVKTKKCPYGFTKETDGLSKDWSFYERIFVNPPYSREIGLWMKKAYEEGQKGARVVCLIPSRTDTKWWHNYCMKAKEIIFFEGRIKFEQNGKVQINAPFPSCVVIFTSKLNLDSVPEIGMMEV